jgi:hypothetical protein
MLITSEISIQKKMTFSSIRNSAGEQKLQEPFSTFVTIKNSPNLDVSVKPNSIKLLPMVNLISLLVLAKPAKLVITKS